MNFESIIHTAKEFGVEVLNKNKLRKPIKNEDRILFSYLDEGGFIHRAEMIKNSERRNWIGALKDEDGKIIDVVEDKKSEVAGWCILNITKKGD